MRGRQRDRETERRKQPGSQAARQPGRQAASQPGSQPASQAASQADRQAARQTEAENAPYYKRWLGQRDRLYPTFHEPRPECSRLRIEVHAVEQAGGEEELKKREGEARGREAWGEGGWQEERE